MTRVTYLFFVSALMSSSLLAHEIASLNEPLKDTYKLDGEGVFKEFYKTSEKADSYSITCDMGQAIPDQHKKGWYNNKPTPGLKLELRARAVFMNSLDEYSAMGFAVITKNDDVLYTFKPLGQYVRGKWDGDIFASWRPYKADIEVHSELLGASGYAHLDLMDGNGFFYKSKENENPDYFLSSCKRIPKKDLPVYDWR